MTGIREIRRAARMRVRATESNMEAEAAFNPILLDIPNHFETERLLMRALRPGDGVVVNASLLETLDDIRRFPASMIWAMENQVVEKTKSSRDAARRTGCFVPTSQCWGSARHR